ncbi:MAG: MalY/PatB family protein [Bacteroidota bacterium]
MGYNFDEYIPREGTNSVKYDLRQNVFGFESVLPMWVADMDFATPPFIIEALKKRLNHPILGYSFRGESYFNALQNWLLRRHNWEVKREWIAFSPGIVPALNMAIEAFTNAGEGVILQSPVYFPFFEASKNNKCELLENPLLKTNGQYHIDYEQLEKLLPKARVLLLSNPHNPGGRVWTKQELEKLANLCIKYNVLIFADEIHGDLVFQPNVFTPVASLSDSVANHTLTFTAPSKTFNMAGLSTSSVIISNPELKEAFDAVVNRLHIGMGNVMGNVASEAAYQHGAQWLGELLEYLTANLHFMENFLQNELPELTMMRPEGTYLVWVDFSALQFTDEELNQFIIHEAQLGLNRGSMFGSNGKLFMRFNIACPRALLTQGLQQLKDAIINRKKQHGE